MTQSIHPDVAPELVDPLRALLTLTASAPALSGNTLGFYRKRARTKSNDQFDLPAIDCIDIAGNGLAHDFKVWVINASPFSKKPGILHFHGGGFVMGNCQNSFVRMGNLAKRLDCVVVSVEYGLAPEQRIHDVLQQNYLALAWVHRHCRDIGVDAHRIGLLGFSAGGGHAALLAQYAHYKAEYPIRCQALVYPMLDDRTGITSKPLPPVGQYLWTVEQNRYAWQAALGHSVGKASVKRFTVPARSTTLTGLPPAYIAVGDLDLFYDENLRYADALAQAGVAVKCNSVKGAFHAFESIAPDTAMANAFNHALYDALSALLA